MTTYTPASTCIAAVEYDEETETAQVTMVKGGSYTLQGISAIEIERWMNSESVGAYWNANVRGNY